MSALKVKSQYPKSAFTLVELLVVIAIITILAAMLLPTLERGLDSARTQNCANNEKQLFMAFIDYCDSYNSWLPRYSSTQWDGSYTGSKSWLYIMRAELAPAVRPTGSNSSDPRNNYRVAPNGYLHCPADPEAVPADSTGTLGNYAAQGSYGMNPYGIGCVSSSLAKPMAYTQLNQVKLPSRQIGFGDSFLTLYPTGAGGHFPYGSIRYSHGGGVFTNSLFLDGHIKTHDLYSVKTMYVEENLPNPANRTEYNIKMTWWKCLPWGNY